MTEVARQEVFPDSRTVWERDTDLPSGSFRWAAATGWRAAYLWYADDYTRRRLRELLPQTERYIRVRGRNGRVTMEGNEPSVMDEIVPDWFPQRGEVGTV